MKTTTTTVKGYSSTQSAKVTLTETESFGTVEFHVTDADGNKLGSVSSYQGRTDLTPRANTRRDSKVKTLWTARNAKGRSDLIEYTSRAAALRSIVFTY